MNSNILIYQNNDGNIKLDVTLNDETVWLTQEQMAQLFVKAKSTINEHIKNIFAENELIENNVVKKFGNTEFLPLCSDKKWYVGISDIPLNIFYWKRNNEIHRIPLRTSLY